MAGIKRESHHRYRQIPGAARRPGWIREAEPVMLAPPASAALRESALAPGKCFRVTAILMSGLTARALRTISAVRLRCRRRIPYILGDLPAGMEHSGGTDDSKTDLPSPAPAAGDHDFSFGADFCEDAGCFLHSAMTHSFWGNMSTGPGGLRSLLRVVTSISWRSSLIRFQYSGRECKT